MSIRSRLSSWLRGGESHESAEISYAERREFVYLDEVSVLSILASRTRGIATEFTEKQTTSLKSEVGGSAGIGIGGTKANVGTKFQSSEGEASQVLRQAIIQTSFKELYDIERSTLVMHPIIAEQLPTVEAPRDLEGSLDSLKKIGAVIDPGELCRGELLEVEVELEADAIFRMATIITTFFEMMEDNEQLFEASDTSQVPQMRSVVRLLESLLVGLVPIRGRLVDYDWTRIADHEVLVNRTLLCQMPQDTRPKSYPAFLVGVAHRDLFWKDIRRVLFSQAKYTLFCRLATSGLVDRWTPVKLADVFASIAPDFYELIQVLGDELISGFRQGVRSATKNEAQKILLTELTQSVEHGGQVLKSYAETLAAHHSRPLAPDVIDSLTRGVPHAENWLDSVDGYRPVFDKLTSGIDEVLGVETPREVVHDLRLLAVKQTALKDTLELDGLTVSGQLPERRCERFLDSELIAIYW